MAETKIQSCGAFFINIPAKKTSPKVPKNNQSYFPLLKSREHAFKVLDFFAYQIQTMKLQLKCFL